jgi:hypothetical protein
MRSRRGLCVDRRLGRGCARARRVRGVFFSIHHAPLGPIRNIRGAVEVIAISRRVHATAIEVTKSPV